MAEGSGRRRTSKSRSLLSLGTGKDKARTKKAAPKKAKAKKPLLKRSTRATAKKAATKRQATRRSTRKARFSLRRFFFRSFYWAAVSGLWLFVLITALVTYQAANLPPASEWQVPQRGLVIKIEDQAGNVIATRSRKGVGSAVPIEQMPKFLIDALISVEDQRYYYHFGVDPIGLARAVIRNLASGRLAEGGSTLTQQLAKNLFFKADRNFQRKIQEMVMAFWLESNFSKKEILELYFNRVYFGNGAYGIADAARLYYDKSVSQLNLAEAAAMVGLLKAPNRYAPTNNPGLSRRRATTVLALMHDQGYISQQQLKIAFSSPASAAGSQPVSGSEYVADWVAGRVREVMGNSDQDLIVRTTIDPQLQHAAETALATVIDAEGSKARVSQGAAVVMDKNAGVLAMVGGRNYRTSPFNRAIHAKRQPGSAFKPIVYLSALEKGMTPETRRIDRPVRIGKWAPKNYDNRFHGELSLKESLAQSINTIPARLAVDVGPKTIVAMARRLGISSKLSARPAIALGASEVTPFELTSAFVPMANGGRRVVPHVIESIRTPAGKLLYQRKPGNAKRIISASHSAMMNEMMAAVITSGTGKRAMLNRRPAAGKTGTTQNNRDAWFVGYTAQRVATVWMGNDDGKSMKGVTGGTLPAETWRNIMVAAHADLPVRRLPGVYERDFLVGGAQKITTPGATPRNLDLNQPSSSGISTFFKKIFSGTEPR